MREVWVAVFRFNIDWVVWVILLHMSYITYISDTANKAVLTKTKTPDNLAITHCFTNIVPF